MKRTRVTTDGPNPLVTLLLLSCSTLGRILRLTQEVIDYREWIIKKWGGRHLARTESRGETHCSSTAAHTASPL